MARLGWPHGWTLGKRLSAVLLIVFLPLFLLAALAESWSVEQQQIRAREDAVLVAQTSRTLVDQFAKQLQTTTQGVALTLALVEVPLDQSRGGPLLAGLSAELPSLRSVFITDPNGRVTAALRDASLGLDLSQRPYIQALRQGREAVWSGQVDGLLTQEPIFVHARVIPDSRGGTKGYIAAAFYPGAVLGEFARLLPRDAALLLLDEDGSVLYGHRDGAPTSVGSGSRVPWALSGDVVALHMVPGPLGSGLRYGGVARVPSTGWWLAFTRSEEVLAATVQQRLLVELGVITAVLAMAMVAFALLAGGLTRPLATIGRYAREAAAGGMGQLPPTGLSGGAEIEDLAEALSVMAEGLQRREDELRAAVQRRERFLSVASHELRTPLTVMKGLLQLLERRVAGQRPLFSELIQQVDRMNTLVGDLHDVARLQEGRFDLSVTEIDLCELMRQASVRFEQTSLYTPEHTIALEMARPVIGRWDAARLEQVAANLVSNALKYSPDGGAVRIWVTQRDEGAEFGVEDQGVGIPEEEQGELFQPFVRYSTSAHVPGTGLGLYIAHEIVRRHGGRIALQSARGEGTRVVVTLPMASS